MFYIGMKSNTTICLDPEVKRKGVYILQNKMNTSLSSWVNENLKKLINLFSKSKLTKEVKNDSIVKG